MTEQRCELMFIIDRSGSMAGLESDTIGGFNAMLEQQKKVHGNVAVTTVLFDNEYQLLHDRVDIKGIASMTSEDYYVRGTTALLDAIGMTVNRISEQQRKSEEKADKVICVIITDGAENSSTEYNYDQVKQLVRLKQEEGWEFLFLGANIDAIATAAAFGINHDRATNFVHDSRGTSLNYEVVSETLVNMRFNKQVDHSWKSRIEEDLAARGASELS